MKIKFDENGYVIGYATLGGMEGAVEWSGPVPEDFSENSQYYQVVNGALELDGEKQAAEAAREAETAELAELLAWFHWYDNQICQYERSVRLGESFDRDVAQLDAQAREKQSRIRMLRGE